MATLSLELFERLQKTLENDPEMKVSCRFMQANILFADDDHGYILKFEKGRLAEIIPDPHPSFAWSFAIRASDDAWNKFLAAVPPPEYNDLWAAAFTGHMVFEGDTLVFFQNHFAVWHVLRVLRAEASAVAA